MSPFLLLNRPTLINLAAALETKRLTPPFSSASLANYIPTLLCSTVIEELNQLHDQGATPAHIAYTLRLLASERGQSQEKRDRVDLVWTGPEVVGAESRDTKVVVQELFNAARKSVLVSSFALDQGEKAQQLFRGLGQRLDANPKLQVSLFLNIQRPHKSTLPNSVLLREFAETFRHQIWTGKQLPEVFYDSRSLEQKIPSKACLHAKCVIVDNEQVLITSANFTEAAHQRNIEAGVLLTDVVVAKALRSQFETLITANILRRIPGI